MLRHVMVCVCGRLFLRPLVSLRMSAGRSLADFSFDSKSSKAKLVSRTWRHSETVLWRSCGSGVMIDARHPNARTTKYRLAFASLESETSAVPKPRATGQYRSMGELVPVDTEWIGFITLFYLLSDTELFNYFSKKLPDPLCYICLLDLENTVVFMQVISWSFVVFIHHTLRASP